MPTPQTDLEHARSLAVRLEQELARERAWRAVATVLLLRLSSSAEWGEDIDADGWTYRCWLGNDNPIELAQGVVAAAETLPPVSEYQDTGPK